MRYTIITLGSLAAFASSANALTFTSPAAGTNIDPTQSIVVSWTSDSADPSSFDLKLGNSNPDSLYPEQTLGTAVSTSAGSYTVPPYTILSFGGGYQVQAINAGSTIAQTSDLTLGAGENEVSTASNGQLSFVGATATNAASSAGQSVPASTTESATLAPASTGGITTLTGAETTTEGQSSSSETGFATQTSQTSSKSNSQITSAATSTSSSTTANGQARLGGDRILSAAGLLAGVVALLA